MSNGSILFQRLFNFIPDIGVKLGNSAYVRRFEQSNDWSRIRLGALVAVVPISTNNVLDLTFQMGLSSSVASPGSAYSGKNFVGIRGFGSGTATYAANGGYPVFTGRADIIRCIDRATTTAVTGGTTCNVAAAYVGSRFRRTPIIIDITRPQGGGGSTTVTAYCCSSAAAQVDYRPDHLMQAIDNWGTPVINGQTLTSWVTGTVNLSEYLGKLDQFEMWWSMGLYPLEVYALGASILLSGYYADDFGGALETFERGTTSGSHSFRGTSVETEPLYGSFYSPFSSWLGDGTLIGFNTTGTGLFGYYGTSAAMPFETFNAYQDGTVGAGVTLNLGKHWASDGTIIPY